MVQYRVPNDFSGQIEIHHFFNKLTSKRVTLETPFSVPVLNAPDTTVIIKD